MKRRQGKSKPVFRFEQGREQAEFMDGRILTTEDTEALVRRL